MRKQTEIYPPNCAANCSDRWLAGIRVDGFLIDRRPFDTEAEARQWAESYTGTEIAPAMASAYVRMLNEWGR